MTPPPPTTDDALPVRRPPADLLGPGVLIPAYVLLVVVAFALFARGYCTRTGNEPSRPRSLMTVVNAATLTGFQQAQAPADFNLLGQVTTLVLMAGGSLLSLVGGGLAVVRIARLPYRDGTVAAVAAAAVVASMAAGVAIVGPGRPVFAAAFQGLSAFGNCGLFLGRLPAGHDWRAQGVLLPLAVLGSLGVPVLIDLARLRPSAHTARVLVGWGGAYLLTVAVLFPLLAWLGSPPDDVPAARWAFGVASREAVNARSAGFPFQFLSELPTAVGAVLVVAMAVGGVPGGTAGGVKVTTVVTVLAGLTDTARRRPLGRAFGIAVAVVVGWVGVVMATWVAFVVAEPEVRPDRALFLAASAVGNVGLSHDRVSPSAAGMVVLSVAMLLGRVLPVVVLWTIADRAADVTDAIG